MATDNVTLARRWFEEVWNQRRTDTIDELVAPDGVCQSESGLLRGPEEFKAKAHAPFLAAFPDLRITVEGTVSEGDQVVVRWRATGTTATASSCSSTTSCATSASRPTMCGARSWCGPRTVNTTW